MARSKLERAEAEASVAHYDKRMEYDAAYSKAKAEAIAKIERDLAPLAAEVARLSEVYAAASDAVAAAKEQAALDGKCAPYPIGTKLYEWESQDWSGSRWSQTGNVGVIEVWTAESERSANNTYSLPSRGDYCIRVLKADGTPSKRVITMALANNWHPEGWKPKAVSQ